MKSSSHQKEKIIYSLFPFLLYIVLWVVWALFDRFNAQETVSPAGSLLMKTFLWGLLPLAAMVYGCKKSPETWTVPVKELFNSKFPFFSCTVALCLSTAFLYTVRIINGYVGSYVLFDWYFIASSLCAGVVEEFFFRAYLFGGTEPFLGFWPATVLNGVLFTLYHYPGLLFGESLLHLFSLRGLLIFVMGVIFCAMLKKWRCIALNMTVHTVWNILSYLFCVG